MSLESKLRDRAEMLARVRAFFSERGVLEVDCSSIVPFPAIDSGVEAVPLEEGYLHTSPEYQMKRLLAAGSGDIFYLGHVYRKGERGRLHHPEFTMVEWYRVGVSNEAIRAETVDLIALFLGPLPIQTLTYREAFLLYADLDPFSNLDFVSEALRLGLEIGSDYEQWDRDMWLNLILSHIVEPQLGIGKLTVLCDYPASQAALARIVQREGRLVSERFEMYHAGVELSNGYHELADAKELRSRLERENLSRKKQGKRPYPLDHSFLDSVQQLPDCCGVSVGFDRLMLLRNRFTTLIETIV